MRDRCSGGARDAPPERVEDVAAKVVTMSNFRLRDHLQRGRKAQARSGPANAFRACPHDVGEYLNVDEKQWIELIAWSRRRGAVSICGMLSSAVTIVLAIVATMLDRSFARDL
ncbi:MAG: hypothetical protein HYS06_07935 [Methylocystis sp.]|nr:hypothetical protein [Methylocystis sp.]